MQSAQDLTRSRGVLGSPLLVALCLLGCRSTSIPNSPTAAQEEESSEETQEMVQLRLAAQSPWRLPWDHGTWCCCICGAVEDQTRHENRIVERTDANLAGDEEGPSPSFREWYGRAIAKEHEHDWFRLGCHGRGLTEACREAIGCVIDFPFPLYFSKVPGLQDPQLARRVVDRIATAPSERRYEMLSYFEEYFEESPLGRVARGEAVAEEELHLFLLRWAACEPKEDEWSNP
jgi:hypothetical protein